MRRLLVNSKLPANIILWDWYSTRLTWGIPLSWVYDTSQSVYRLTVAAVHLYRLPSRSPCSTTAQAVPSSPCRAATVTRICGLLIPLSCLLSNPSYPWCLLLMGNSSERLELHGEPYYDKASFNHNLPPPITSPLYYRLVNPNSNKTFGNASGDNCA